MNLHCLLFRIRLKTHNTQKLPQTNRKHHSLRVLSMSAPCQLCSSHSWPILPHSTISPQNHPTRRVKPSVSRRFWRHKSGGVASGSPRVPRCEQALRCDFTHYSQSGGGSQIEPVNYRCLNCRGVWTHTYTRAPLYCLIGVNNGFKLICRFGIRRYVIYIYIKTESFIYTVVTSAVIYPGESTGYMTAALLNPQAIREISALPLVLICISFSLVPPLRIIKF